MYISAFLLICAIVYMIHLYGKKRELIELQKTIALLQEQILLFEGIERRIRELEKAGVTITNLKEKNNKDEGNDVKEFIKTLSRAYFSGWYQLSGEERKRIHLTREEVEHKIPW